MKKTIAIFAVTFILLTSCLGQDAERDAVKASFDNYKTAILNDNGEEAVKWVDSRTIDYYSDILEKVKKADSVAVESLSLLDKLMVFSIRHRTSKEDILSFDGKELLAYAVESGMVGKNSVANNAVGEITIDGDFAKGQLISRGQAAPLYFHFYRQDNEWKINLTSMFPVSSIAFKKMIEDSGQEENDFLFMLLEMLTGEEPGQEIWMPVEKQ